MTGRRTCPAIQTFHAAGGGRLRAERVHQPQMKGNTLHLKKKIAVIAASVAAVAVVGTSAWAYVVITGSGNGNAATSADTATLALSATAAIADLDQPAAIAVKGTSKKNRHISTLAVTLGTVPPGCEASWFEIAGTGLTAGGYTFTTNTEETISAAWTITMKNVDADQTPCLGKNIPLTVTAS